jgi:hypothetical protein
MVYFMNELIFPQLLLKHFYASVSIQEPEYYNTHT